MPETAPQNLTEGARIIRQNIQQMIFCLEVVFVSPLVPCRVSAQTLLARLATGKWPDVDAASLNSAATALGPNFNVFATSQGAIVPVVPAFVDFQPSVYLRPFDAEAEECDSSRSWSERASHVDLHRDNSGSLIRALQDRL